MLLKGATHNRWIPIFALLVQQNMKIFDPMQMFAPKEITGVMSGRTIEARPPLPITQVIGHGKEAENVRIRQILRRVTARASVADSRTIVDIESSGC